MQPIGEITAAVPQRPHSAKSESSETAIFLSSTSIPRTSFATTKSERRVIDGRIESDFGVTNLPSFVIKRMLAPPVSSR